MPFAVLSGSVNAAEIGGDLPEVSDWKVFSDSSLLLLDESVETRLVLIDSPSSAAEREQPVADSQSFLFAQPSLSEVGLAVELEPAGILIEIMTHQHDAWNREQQRILFAPMAWDGFVVGGL